MDADRLCELCEAGDLASVQEYLATGADVDVYDRLIYRTILCCPLLCCFSHVVLICASSGAVGACNSGYFGGTPLSYAAGCGHAEVVGALLAAGALPDLRDRSATVTASAVPPAGGLVTARRADREGPKTTFHERWLRTCIQSAFCMVGTLSRGLCAAHVCDRGQGWAAMLTKLE